MQWETAFPITTIISKLPLVQILYEDVRGNQVLSIFINQKQTVKS